MVMICPFCRNEAPWVENKAIYGRNYGKSYMCYYCKDCDAYVGCHNNTRKPLGVMANAEMRYWRKKAHAHFDPIWKDGGIPRGKAYAALSRFVGKVVHVGESDIETCKKILEFSYSSPQQEERK